ncbi:hypothetical protein NQ318_007531 [Aromia moschata]|uniref:Uncharacterized protein n=1 Tax=Aromia moschata TaxID=1265417 RepID=A0AAV8YDZ8_9CUCU|nr:hypothetical protein NQ318_007531 [Aromia moschata]
MQQNLRPATGAHLLLYNGRLGWIQYIPLKHICCASQKVAMYGIFSFIPAREPCLILTMIIES